MREIKFRAYDTHTKTMLPIVDIIKFTKSEGIYITRDSAYGVGINIQYQPHIEIMQFTGLHDKNGKEIYEGDIVKRNEHSIPEEQVYVNAETGQIKYLDGSFGFYKNKGKIYLFNPLHDELAFDELKYYEVIGNIYDNPELLKGEQS